MKLNLILFLSTPSYANDIVHTHSKNSIRLNVPSLTKTIPSTLQWMAIVTLTIQFSLSLPPPCPADELAKATQARFEKHCFDCHAHGAAEGGFDFEKLASGGYGADTQAKWETVWKNIRAQTMPPAEAEAPSVEERSAWIHWIQQDIFQLDPKKIDPGHIVLRRLNRSEYRETIKALTDVDFKVNEEFPADDTGYGFDTVGESLTLSPVLLEKYLAAAADIVSKFAPLEGPTPPEVSFWSDHWKRNAIDGTPSRQIKFDETVNLHFKKKVPKPGRYKLSVQWHLENAWTTTSQDAKITLSIVNANGESKTLDQQQANFATGPDGILSGEVELQSEDIYLVLDFQSLNADTKTNVDDPKNLRYDFSLRRTTFVGPLEGAKLEYREPARKVFFNGPPPVANESATAANPEFAASVREHMKVIVRRFANQAFRRPIDEPSLDRLCDIGMRIANEPGKRYENGAAAALQLVLASPRFLYRVELPSSSITKSEDVDSALVSRIDDYALASRLSYLLWGAPPDEELMKIAAAGTLHDKIAEQFDRMTAQDWRLQRGIENFVGQWLRTRDVQETQVDVKQILRLRRDDEADRMFNWKVRDSMAKETYRLYQYLLTENRPAEELISARYTFLNESLAKFYGIEGIQGDEMRRMDLPPESHRRGLLSHGSVLLVTSNPTRTSPVKRGLFLLDNLLGTPAPPAPPNVPALEASKSGPLKSASLRQVLEFHRRDAACAACHQRMDPLGLAMENFNAIGQWRDVEKGRPAFGNREEEPDQPIDPAGKLMTGETFASVDELAGILADKRKEDFYRCLTEKIFTFALGRGITYRDSTAIDLVVDQVKKDNGSLRTLYKAIVTSVPFTHCRTPDAPPTLTSK